MIYHITKNNLWEMAQGTGQYLPAEFDRDGFIHVSEWYQLQRTANTFYPGQSDLIVLEIETQGTELPVVYENLDGGTELFPHIYGPLPITAVADTFTFDKDECGRWQLPVHKERHSHPGPTLIPLGTAGKLYRSSMPYSSMFDPEDKIFAAYKKLGVEVVVVLNEISEIQRYTGKDLISYYQANGMQVIHSPIIDFTAPQPGVWNEAIKEVEDLLQSGKTLAMHCHAGIGRTGMFIACLAQDVLGLQGEDSIAWARNFIPSAVETEYQRQFVLEYQANKA